MEAVVVVVAVAVAVAVVVVVVVAVEEEGRSRHLRRTGKDRALEPNHVGLHPNSTTYQCVT